MEQGKKMYSRILEQIGGKEKIYIGVIFILAGIIGQMFSEKTLGHVPFLLMAVGLLCFVNTLFSKIADTNIDLLLYQLICVAALEIGLALTSFDFIGNAGITDHVTFIGMWLLCIAAVWILQSFLIKIDNFSKRLVLALAETLASGLAVLVALFLPILVSVLWGKG